VLSLKAVITKLYEFFHPCYTNETTQIIKS